MRAEARSGEEKGVGEIKRAKSAGVVERGREKVSERARARARARGARWGGGKGM